MTRALADGLLAFYKRSAAGPARVVLLAGLIGLLGSCDGSKGEPGAKGEPGTSGEKGDPGAAGTKGDPGAAGTKGDPGAAGAPGTNGTNGMNAGFSPGLRVKLEVSKPSNSTHFVPGDRPVITITVTDEAGAPIPREGLSQARLMMVGPNSALKAKTASKLLNVSAARTATEHHFVDLTALPTPGGAYSWKCSVSAAKHTCTSTATDAKGGTDWTCATAGGTTTCEKPVKTNLAVKGNVLTYTLEPVTTEEPGTYLVSFWAISKDFPIDQAFPVQELQLGAAAVEKEIVGNCADCHKGALSGMTYLHHIDREGAAVGNYAIDSDPVRTCKNCHNQDGYAAYCGKQGESPCQSTNRVSDAIVRRVHGVHMGGGCGAPGTAHVCEPTRGLSSLFNIDPVTGDFRDYTSQAKGGVGSNPGVRFPANPRNCTKCHLDDSWKTKPSTQACASCHDNLDAASGVLSPPRVQGRPKAGKCKESTDCVADFNKESTCNATTGMCQLAVHLGGKQTDGTCANCHGPNGTVPVAKSHEIEPLVQPTAELSMTPPANGTHYVGGEAPTVKIVLKDSKGVIADPTAIKPPAWLRFNLFVSGPRSQQAMPVLTTAARGEAMIRAAVTCKKAGPWSLSTTTDLRVKIDGGAAIIIPISSGTFANLAAATAAEAAAWLNANATFKAVATASASGSSAAPTLTIKSNSRGATSSVEVLASTVGSALEFPAGIAVPVETDSYPANHLNVPADPRDDDPKVKRTPGANGFVEYQLDDVKGLAPGTYTAFVEMVPSGITCPDGHVCGGVAKLNFQVGTKAVDEYNATNCSSCHANTAIHENYWAVKFDTDLCRSCHDYDRQLKGRSGWAKNSDSNNGFGAAPLSRRVHGVHYGHYLDKPLEVAPAYNPTVNFAARIFPQDIRNCTTCHAKADYWKQRPSRLACLSCHDRDSAILHGMLNTFDPTPAEPYSGDEKETCASCHGVDRQFAADKVHAISRPYKPPYPREKK